MSKKNRPGAGLTSQQIQQQFMEVCTKLGQEIANQDRAIKNQATLRKAQYELEEAFLHQARLEQEAAQAKARDDKRKSDAAGAQALKDPAHTARNEEGIPTTPPT